MFQFPSSGKAYSNRFRKRRVPLRYTLSFNSLQAGKPIQTNYMPRSYMPVEIRFNSLQAGKPIQTSSTSITPSPQKLFQFPSSGKAYSNYTKLFQSGKWMLWFQFPSSGKAYSNLTSLMRTYKKLIRLCFNSLQAGKPIQT